MSLTEVALHKPSILVVDDNPMIVHVLRSLLQAQQFDVVCAVNGEDALQQLSKREVDVIICDVMMPKMDGYELHHSVRSKAELAHIPFVFLTALDDEREKLKGHESGADDYLTKPFDPQTLLAIVKGKVLRAKTIKQSSDARNDIYRKRVIHTLSHEFRTPLVAINTGTEMLLEQLVQQHGNLTPERAKSLIEAIHRGGLRLERLVTDFMLLQQIEAGISQRMYDTRAELCKVSSILELVSNATQEDLKRTYSDLQINNLCLTERVFVYELQIVEILNRLISNSVKFSAPKSVVELFVYKEEHEIVFEVRDRGIGFNPAKIKEAIEAFGQLNREQLEQQGSGLGLAIASRYAAINKSRLSFHERQGGGAVVTLRIAQS